MNDAENYLLPLKVPKLLMFMNKNELKNLFFYRKQFKKNNLCFGGLCDRAPVCCL